MFLQFFKISIGDFLCCYKPISPTILTDLVLNIIGWAEVFLLGVGWSRVATVFEDVPNEALEHVWGREHEGNMP